MKAAILMNLAAMICAAGTRPVTVHAVTECKEVRGVKESWFTIMAGADGVKASEGAGYEYKGGPSYMERLSRLIGRHKGNGQIYFLVSLESCPKNRKTGKKQWRSIYRGPDGKICPPPPATPRPIASDDWRERPYKVESIKSIRYGGKTYT